MKTPRAPRQSTLRRTWLLGATLLGVLRAAGQMVLPELDPKEAAGARPYEMVWAHRTEPAPPTIRFDRLAGWTMRVEHGAQAILQASRAQNLWDRPVARLRYRGPGTASPSPRVLLFPPQPIVLPADADAVDLWVYGNRWDWVHPPDTPPVRIMLRLRDDGDQLHEVFVDSVRWEEWWLLHRKLPATNHRSWRLEGLEIAGGWQSAWREIFFDSIRCYREPLAPLNFAAQPRRHLQLFRGQSPGVNIGPGTLPFPTRAQTILPLQFVKSFHDRVVRDGDGRFRFEYAGSDGSVVYRFDPRRGLSGIRAELNGQSVGTLMNGARLVYREGPGYDLLQAATLAHRVVSARYTDGTTLRLRLWQKSLVIDVFNHSGDATELRLGEITDAVNPHTVWLPYVTCGGSYPCVAWSEAGTTTAFTSVWVDWYRSNGAELYGADSRSPTTARINGGVRYLPRTDGHRNPLYERLFLTVSPR
ncbi:MAG: hypothetical protein KGS61_14685, partial [Verrucomicrobia bacterium]|nr:hypothetical protein [Verrucomicrobiota bacterium]